MAHVQTDNAHPTLRVDARRLARHLEGALRAMAHPDGVVDVQLVDDATIHELNQRWRGVDAVTDVLSFALRDQLDDEAEVALPAEAGVGFELLGDIVISLDTAARQAADMRRFLRESGLPARYSLWQETAFLATHGLLHLLGYDHQATAEAEEMEALERDLIGEITDAPVHDLDRTRHGL